MLPSGWQALLPRPRPLDLPFHEQAFDAQNEEAFRRDHQVPAVLLQVARDLWAALPKIVRLVCVSTAATFMPSNALGILASSLISFVGKSPWVGEPTTTRSYWPRSSGLTSPTGSTWASMASPMAHAMISVCPWGGVEND